jgi:glycosyltransferase involved in cell wall biosynthesis
MRILVALTYYRPHVSGLTVYAERLARAWVARGHQVTVLTSQYDRGLARHEQMDGVNVLRMPVLLRISKGVIMPSVGLEATRQVRKHDVLSLHLPQFDAAGIALKGKRQGRPTVLTYHCDVRLPVGIFNVAANSAVNLANRLAAGFADTVVAYTEDYAKHSPFLSRYAHKLRVIPPPVEVTPCSEGDAAAFAARYRRGSGPVIGLAARLATEKGVEYLAKALPRILDQHPQAQVLFAGQHENVLGEAEYARRLAPVLDGFRDHWTFLGVLEPNRMSAFFKTCDVTVLPSLNSTESFGLVQIESMICGTPVVASELPGVRQPVVMTGMGEIVPPRDPEALAGAILRILDHRPSYLRPPEAIAKRFAPETIAEQYEALFAELQARRAKGGPG